MSDTSGWYLAQDSKSVGPTTLDQLIGRLDTVSGLDTLVYGPDASEWVAARQVAAIVGPSADAAGSSPPPPPPTGRRTDVIDYDLFGNGIALVHAGGTLARRELEPGEVARLDTGCLVALMPSVSHDIQTVGGVKNTLFGGEWLFVATLTGPRQVWMQSLPFSRLAGRMLAAVAQPGGSKS